MANKHDDNALDLSDLAAELSADKPEKTVANTPAKKNAVQGAPKTIRIIIDETPEFPAHGQFIGYNGRDFRIQAGVEVDVPPGIVEILEHAIVSVPRKDPMTDQIIGYSNRHRFPFRTIHKAAGS